ncbi:hypothetical protein B2J88_36410 [Rhodococcus sp. SRB_17]|nr:hypothetical protein [Rhodococcus sp. SRB_17]
MQVRQVGYFLAVVDHGNIRRASAALGLAQPSVSQAIAVLEQELGAQLFIRTGQGGVSLSSAGIAFLGPARRLVRISQSADKPDSAVSLDIATWGNLALDPTARVIARLRTENPALSVRIEYGDDEAAVCELVRGGHCEVGTVYLPADEGDLDVQPIGSVELQLISPPGTDLGPNPLPLKSISNYPMIRVAGGSQNVLLDRMFADAGVSVSYGVISTHRQALVNLVLTGAGSVIAGSTHARQAAARGAEIRSFDPPIVRPYGLVYRAESLSVAARDFIECASLLTP